MSLTRRNWFLHRVVPTATLFAAGAAAGSGALSAVSAAAAPNAANNSGKPKAKSPLDKTAKVHPFLQYGAQVEPDKKVTVIVQKKKGGKSVTIAQAHGSAVKDDFDFINTFTMEIQLKNVMKLGQHKDVGFVSYDHRLHFSSIDTSKLKTTYPGVVNAPTVWNTMNLTGSGVTVAVLDSGVNAGHPDFKGSKLTTFLVNKRATGKNDKNGHGTHVTGIITGKDIQGRYIGVAPDANIMNLQIADDTGCSRESDLIAALSWVAQNRTAYNIKVINLSVNGSVPTSYLTSPICAACEVLMMKGVVVVVAAGNRGSDLDAVQYAPACDPFVVSVGCYDDNKTASTADDGLAFFSSRGTTLDGLQKPDICAPGRYVVSTLASSSCVLALQHPDRITDSNYIRLSGTSMASPVVAGICTLLYQKYPNLTAGQVKWLLLNTMKSFPGQVGTAGLVDTVALFNRAASGSIGDANAGKTYASAVADGMSTVQGTSAYWDSAYWDSAYWDANAWESADYETFDGE